MCSYMYVRSNTVILEPVDFFVVPYRVVCRVREGQGYGHWRYPGITQVKTTKIASNLLALDCLHRNVMHTIIINQSNTSINCVQLYS